VFALNAHRSGCVNSNMIGSRTASSCARPLCRLAVRPAAVNRSFTSAGSSCPGRRDHQCSSAKAFHASRAFASASRPPSGAPSSASYEIFNRRLKWLQRERAAKNAESSRQVDYLRDEVASRLCERLLVRIEICFWKQYATFIFSNSHIQC